MVMQPALSVGVVLHATSSVAAIAVSKRILIARF
jgi:hypothetical protein